MPWDAEGTERQGSGQMFPLLMLLLTGLVNPFLCIVDSFLLPAIRTALPEPATVGKVVSQTVSSKLHKGKPGSHRIHTGRTVLLVTPVSYLPVVWGVVETYIH